MKHSASEPSKIDLYRVNASDFVGDNAVHSVDNAHAVPMHNDGRKHCYGASQQQGMISIEPREWRRYPDTEVLQPDRRHTHPFPDAPVPQPICELPRS
jgi:hypothetical protein